MRKNVSRIRKVILFSLWIKVFFFFTPVAYLFVLFYIKNFFILMDFLEKKNVKKLSIFV